jgi:hypothetical protein
MTRLTIATVCIVSPYLGLLAFGILLAAMSVETKP